PAQSLSPCPSWPSPGSRTSPLSVTFEFDLTPDIVASQHLAALQVHQLDQEAEAGDLAAQHLDQLAHRPGGAAGGDEVVHHQHPLAGQDGVLVDMEDVVAVFQ